MKSMLPTAVAIGLMVASCSATQRPPVSHRAGPGPSIAPTLRPSDLAHGRGVIAIAQPNARIERLMLDGERAPVLPPAVPMRDRTATRARPAARPSATQSVPVRAPLPVPAQPTVVAAALPPPPPVREDAERYSAREASASEQLEYQGGDAIVISLSVVLVIALIVVLILLLT